MNLSPHFPALTAKAHAFAEHLAQLADGLPESLQASMPVRQAFFAGLALEEQLTRAAAASTSRRYHAALDTAVAEARSAGYWLDTLGHDMPETARLCLPLTEEAGQLTELLVEAAY